MLVVYEFLFKTSSIAYDVRYYITLLDSYSGKKLIVFINVLITEFKPKLFIVLF